MLTHDKVRERLRYDPDTGHFYWIVRPSNRVDIEKPAGTLTQGYVNITIYSRIYRAHRLAWLYMTGEWPKFCIDHINLDRSDNRWINLRSATRSENQHNQGTPSHNTSGFKGVFFEKRSKRWIARIKTSGKTKHIGSFATPEEAHEAYKSACLKHHGEFANFGKVAA